MGEPRGERIIHKAVPGYTAQAFEALAHQAHRKVPALAGPGVASVKVAVVRDGQGVRVQRSPQGRLDVLCAWRVGRGIVLWHCAAGSVAAGRAFQWQRGAAFKPRDQTSARSRAMPN